MSTKNTSIIKTGTIFAIALAGAIIGYLMRSGVAAESVATSATETAPTADADISAKELQDAIREELQEAPFNKSARSAFKSSPRPMNAEINRARRHAEAAVRTRKDLAPFLQALEMKVERTKRVTAVEIFAARSAISNLVALGELEAGEGMRLQSEFGQKMSQLSQQYRAE